MAAWQDARDSWKALVQVFYHLEYIPKSQFWCMLMDRPAEGDRITTKFRSLK